jgi:hypothetical protein
MSMVFASGWETRLSRDGGNWTSGFLSGSSGVTNAIRRGPNYSMNFATAGDNIRKVLNTTADEIFLQSCFYWSGTPSSSAGRLLRMARNSNVYFSIVLDANGCLNIYTGDSATLVATGTTTLLINRWYVIEVHFKYHATAGTIEVRLDGSSECSWSGDTTLGISTGFTTTAKARMKFTPGALTVDSLGNLPNWSQTGSPVASTTLPVLEGGTSLYCDNTSRLTITDANLPAGFPLKSGDTTQLGTWMYWFRLSNYLTAGFFQETISKFDKTNSKLTIEHVLHDAATTFRVGWGYGSTDSQNQETWDTLNMVPGNWYHIAFTYNGPGKTAYLRIFDLFNGTIYTYSKTWTNALRTNAGSPWVIGNNATITNNGGYSWIADYLIFNSQLSEFTIDCFRSIYHDSTFSGSDPYSVMQSNWCLEIYSAGTGMYVDDVIVNDTNGTVNNSWVDQAHITLMKTIGPGSYGDFTPSDSTPTNGWNFLNTLPFSSVNCVFSNTPGTCHSCLMTNVPFQTVEVDAIIGSARIWKTPSAAASTVNLLIVAGSTVFQSPDAAIPSRMLSYSGSYSANSAVITPYCTNFLLEPPSSNPFSRSELDGILEIGLKIS